MLKAAAAHCSQPPGEDALPRDWEVVVPTPLARGKKANQQRPLDKPTVVRQEAIRLTALDVPQRPHGPAIAVGPEGDVEKPAQQVKRGRPKNNKEPATTVGKAGPDAQSVAQQMEEIIGNDKMLSEPTLDDVLADRQKYMSCTD